MNFLLYAYSIGYPDGKKATIDHSSCVEHHSQWVSSPFRSFLVLDARRQAWAKYISRRYVLIKEHHWILFSSRIFRLGSYSIHFFHFPHMFINHFSFTNPKNKFPPSTKGFQSSQGVWKHLFGSFHLRTHNLHFIVHLHFFNQKIPKNIFWFQSLNLPARGFDLDLPLF